MEHDKFLSKLKEFAEINTVRTGRSKVVLPEDSITIEIRGQTLTLREEDNPTRQPEIREVKSRTAPCDDCGRIVTDRKVEIRAYFTGPVPHYRHNCQACKRTKDPYTGEYTVSLNNAYRLYEEFYFKKYPNLKLEKDKNNK